MDILTRYDWPGNIRELQNVIERAVVLSRGSVLRLGSDLLPLSNDDPTPASELASHSSGERKSDEVNGHLSLSQVEKLHILEILEKAHWVIEGNRGAATILGLHPNTLRSRMKRLGIHRSLSPSSHEISQPRSSR
jgi:transcriptional regulator with GAF, ATPase, and Fis domain